MIRTLCMALSVGLVLGLASFAAAEEKKEAKETKLEGTICCAKCELSKSDKCATVIKVKGKDGKEVIYWFDAAGDKKHHSAICTEAKAGMVMGTVKKDGDKMVVTVSKCEFKK